MAHDLLLRGGLVVDGTGRPAYAGDVAVDGGRVSEVGPSLAGAATRTIDAEGMVVAPGFIDVHTHYDAQVLWDPLLGPSTQYGVTTLVMGNCGIGVAPIRAGGPAFLVQLLANVEGMPVPALEQGLDWDWSSFGDWLDRIDHGLGPNVMPLVGHSALRHTVMGEEASARAATPEELEAMQAHLRRALAAGAWGFSSSAAATHNDLAGRPAPSRLADLFELGALADVVGEFPFGVIGMSPESKLRGLTAEDRALLTMLSLRGGASVNWNPLIHTSALADLWRVNLTASEEAAHDGARVYAVWNPASSGGTRVDLETCFLFMALPRWKAVAKAPKPEKLVAFRDPAQRAELADDLEHDTSLGMLSARLRTMWDILRVTQVQVPANEGYLGRTVGEIARETGRTPLDTMLDIAVADDLATVFMQDDVRQESDDARKAFGVLARSPHVLFGGTDAGAHLDMLANESLFARTMSWRVREEGVLSLEEAVRQFTSAIADALGLEGHGRLQPGQAADVVVFDLDHMGAGPARVVHDLPGGAGRLSTAATGVRHVVVGGEVLFDDGEPTGALPGRLLRAGAPRP